MPHTARHKKEGQPDLVDSHGFPESTIASGIHENFGPMLRKKIKELGRTTDPRKPWPGSYPMPYTQEKEITDQPLPESYFSRLPENVWNITKAISEVSPLFFNPFGQAKAALDVRKRVKRDTPSDVPSGIHETMPLDNILGFIDPKLVKAASDEFATQLEGVDSWEDVLSPATGFLAAHPGFSGFNFAEVELSIERRYDALTEQGMGPVSAYSEAYNQAVDAGEISWWQQMVLEGLVELPIEGGAIAWKFAKNFPNILKAASKAAGKTAGKAASEVPYLPFTSQTASKTPTSPTAPTTPTRITRVEDVFPAGDTLLDEGASALPSGIHDVPTTPVQATDVPPITAGAGTTARESVRINIINDLRLGEDSTNFMFHASNEIEDIVKKGLKSGGLSPIPIQEQGYGDIIHVFRISDLPPNIKDLGADISFGKGFDPLNPPKPIATFTRKELGGLREEKLIIGARGEELGFTAEPPDEYFWSPEELAESELLIAADERKIINRIEQAYATPTQAADVAPTPTQAVPEGADIKMAQTGQPFRGILFRGSGRETLEEVYDTHFAQGPILGEATYSSPSRKFAKDFGPQVDELEVSLRNPLVISSDDEWRALTAEARLSTHVPMNAEEIARLRQVIRGKGHDGVIVRVPESEMVGKRLQQAFGEDTVVSFDPITPPTRAAGVTVPPTARQQPTVSSLRGELDDLEMDLIEVNTSLELAETRKIVRPQWATGLTNPQLAGIARHEGLDPFLKDWADGIDQEFVKAVRRDGDFKDFPVTATAADLRRQRAVIKRGIREVEEELKKLRTSEATAPADVPSLTIGRSITEQFSEGINARSAFEGGEVIPGLGYSWRSMGPAEYKKIIEGKAFGGPAQRGGYWAWFPSYSANLKGTPKRTKYLVEVEIPSSGETLSRKGTLADVRAVWKHEGKGWVTEEFPTAPADVAPTRTAGIVADVPDVPPADISGAIQRGGPIDYRAPTSPAARPVTKAPRVPTARTGTTRALPTATTRPRTDILDEIGRSGGSPESPPLTTSDVQGRPPHVPGGKTQRMFEENADPNTKDWVDQHRKFQELVNDRFWGLRRMFSRVQKKRKIEPGSAEDLPVMLDLMTGGVHAAAARYEIAINDIKRIGKGIDPADIDAILYLSNASDVIRRHGPDRDMPLGIQTERQVVDELSEIRIRLGGKRWNKAREAAEVVRRVYKEERERFVRAGYITRDEADLLDAEYPWYNPMYIVDEIGRQTAFKKGTNSFDVGGTGFERIAPHGTTKDVQSPLTTLFTQLAKNESRIRKNEISKAMVMLAIEAGEEVVKKGAKVSPTKTTLDDTTLFFDEPGTLSYFSSETGSVVRHVFEVPNWIAREASYMNQAFDSPVTTLGGAINGISKAAYTTFSPVFVVANVFNDMIGAFIKRGILPIGPNSSSSMLLNLMRGIQDDKLMQVYRLSAGFQNRFFGRDAFKIANRMGLEPGKVITNNHSWRRTILDAIPRIGEAGEQAPRLALFKRELDKTLPNWRNMSTEEVVATTQSRVAAAAAVDLTINFARGGTLIKSINPFVLFLNASMESVKQPFRALAGPHRKSVALRLGGIVSGYMGLMAYNLTFPEYMDIRDEHRRGSIIVMIPSWSARRLGMEEKDKNTGRPKPNYVTIIPRTREWSMFFAPVSYIMETLYKKDPESFGDFSRTLVPNLAPIDTLGGLGPEILTEITEQQANWDLFRSRPVVPSELQSMPIKDQVFPWTSPTMQEIGENVGISPIRLEHAVTGLLGSPSRIILSATDWITTNLLPDEINPQLKANLEYMKTLSGPTERRTFVNSLPNDQRKALNRELKKPENDIPILSQLKDRFVPSRGGGLYETTSRKKANELGLSISDTREVSGSLRSLSEIIFSEQVDNDVLARKGSEHGGITPKEWRDRRSEHSENYQGALMLVKADYPKAAQVADPEVRAKYYKGILDGTAIFNTDEERTQVLMSGWYSISPEKDETGEENWDAFFTMRDEYKAKLNDTELEVLENELQSRMTPLEREFNEDLKVMRKWLSARGDAIKIFGVGKKYKDYLASMDKSSFRNMEKNSDLEAAFEHARDEKDIMRLKSEDGDKSGYNLEMKLWKWGFIATITNPALMLRVGELQGRGLLESKLDIH